MSAIGDAACVRKSPGTGLSRRAAIVGAAGVAMAPCAALTALAAPDISIGLTPVFLSSDLDLLDRIKTYLSRAIGKPVRVVTRRTYQEITSLLISGQLDAAWICGYPFVANRQQLELVAVPLWRKRPLYQSYVIVSREREECASLDDLQKDIHAFSDPDSNSGYLVTAAMLAERNQHPSDFFRKTFFTYAHRNVVRAVASGLADSGSVDGYVWEVMSETDRELTGSTRILLRSPWLGFPPFATSTLKAATSEIKALQSALVDMAQDEVGRSVLDMLRLDGFAIEDASLFDPIAAEATLVQRLG